MSDFQEEGTEIDGGELTLVLGRDVQRWAERNAEVLPLPVLPSTVQDALATNVNGSVEVQVCPQRSTSAIQS